MDRRTGRRITDWAHVIQSIADILSTPFLTRVMRRPYGSDVPNLIDQPMIEGTLLKFYVAVAEALEKYEPRFEIVNVSLSDAGREGRVKMLLEGVYRPRAHRGDTRSATQPNTHIELMLAEDGWAIAA